MVIGFFPAYLFEFAVTPDHGCLQSVGMIIELKRIPAFQAKVSLIYFSIKGCPDTENLTMAGGDFQIASHSAIGTYCSCGVGGQEGFGLKDIGDGRGGTCLHTGTTTYAIGIEEGLVMSFHHMSIKSPSCHTQHKFPLHFVANPDTPVTIDASGKFRDQIRVAPVTPVLKVVFAFGIPDLPDTHFGSHRLKFTIVVHLTGEAILGMIR
jgi:hypothetical protein